MRTTLVVLLFAAAAGGIFPGFLALTHASGRWNSVVDDPPAIVVAAVVTFEERRGEYVIQTEDMIRNYRRQVARLVGRFGSSDPAAQAAFERAVREYHQKEADLREKLAKVRASSLEEGKQMKPQVDAAADALTRAYTNVLYYYR